MKKKILFVTEALWIGGVETALANLLNRLDDEKYDIACLILRKDQTMAKRLPRKVRLLVADRDGDYAHTRLYRLTEEPENPSRRHRALQWTVPAIRWTENRLFIRHVRRKLGQERFDTCVLYTPRVAEVGIRAVKAEKYLLFCHHGAMAKEYHDAIGYRRAEKIIAVSPGQAEKLRAFRPAFAGKIITVPNVTDRDTIRRMAQEPIDEEFSSDCFHIVTCGRISREKGMDLAVEACARLVSMGHRDIRWWLVGGGPGEEALRAKIQETHMEDHVRMVEMRENPYPYIRRADLYVQPSRVESFGLTICEALLLGRQVIATDTDGARELLEPENLCGMDARGIADAVVRVRNNPAEMGLSPEKIRERDRAAIEKLEELL